MKKPIYEKYLVRKPSGRVLVKENESKEIKEYSSLQGCEDFLWYLAESSIPEQITYCSECVKQGKKSVVKDGYCTTHRKHKAKHAFADLTEEEVETNLNFVNNYDWLITSLCDASLRHLDNKKVIKGIIDINKNNKKLSFSRVCEKLTSK